MPVSRRTAEQQSPKGPAPYWRSECGRAVVYVGDMREVLARLDPTQFHAVVTDPPYGLEFMGEEWDAPWKGGGVDARSRRADELDDPIKAKYLRHNVEYVRDSYLYQQWFHQCAEAMLRAAKPGAHLLSFGGTRMWHRMACAVEDAGWEIRDTVMWVYGSGFPKSHDIGKAIDKMAGAEREVVGPGTAPLSQGQFNAREIGSAGYGYKAEYNETAPATDAAKRWDGWGTALKPAVEPILLARRPFQGSVAQCVLECGCGGLNVGGCRVGTERAGWSGSNGFCNTHNASKLGGLGSGDPRPIAGRWPANLIHDDSDEVVRLMPDGASRYFYSPKADSDDRPHGRGATVHPTVKPLDLMRYLVRLVCAPGGVLLDPFSGTGSTGCAAIEEGMRYVGVDQSWEYADLQVGRLKLSLAKAPVGVRSETGQEEGVERDTPPPLERLQG